MISTIRQAAQNIFSRLKWKVYPSTWFSIIAFLSIIPCVMFLPEKFAWENSFIENTQMIVLFVCFFITIKAKWNKKFFNWISFIVVILILREINYGRSFFPKPNVINSFYQWKEIIPNYWWIPRTLYGLFMAYTIYYFFKNNLLKTVVLYIKKAPIDVWNCIFLFLGIILGTLGENTIKNEMLEETTENLFYVAFTVLIWLYSHNKDYKIDDK